MQFDIIIIGGGMVGASIAAALQSQFKVALIDATPPQAIEDKRLIALNYSSYSLFSNLSIWETINPHATPIQEVHVSHQGHFGKTRLLASEIGLPFLGHVVPAKHINEALYSNLNLVTLLRPAKLTHLTQDADQTFVTVETPNGKQELTGKIVIGADGTHSTVRELLAIPTEKIDYQQSAIVTMTELQRSHHHVAYERFLNNGAIAMLPLLKNTAATIWTANNETITQLLQHNDHDFLNRLQKEFGYRLGKLIKIGPRFNFPLQMIKAKQKIQHRVILIGNAAHTLHPIAAQGLNLALYEVAELVNYLRQHSINDISLNEFTTNQEKISMNLSHHLTWLFSKDFFMLKVARQVGMIGFDLCHPLKKKFMLKTKGSVDNLL